MLIVPDGTCLSFWSSLASPVAAQRLQAHYALATQLYLFSCRSNPLHSHFRRAASLAQLVWQSWALSNRRGLAE